MRVSSENASMRNENCECEKKFKLTFYVNLVLCSCDQLIAQNAQLRHQLEESHRTNESLTNDLQKLTNDWESLRDEMLAKEDEWKMEEEVIIFIELFLRGEVDQDQRVSIANNVVTSSCWVAQLSCIEIARQAQSSLPDVEPKIISYFEKSYEGNLKESRL
jgi:Ciliary rootlet component, centrosome cohesion